MMRSTGGENTKAANYRAEVYGRYRSVPVTEVEASHLGPGGSWARAYEYYLRGWLPNDAGARCLDLGCGSGAFVEILAQRGLTAIRGVDRSGEQVAAARARGLPCEVGDAIEALEQHKGDLELVTAFDLIEHFSKDELLRFLRAVRGALALGGSVVIQAPNAASPMGASVRYGDFTHEIGLTPGSLGHLLRLVKFSKIEFREAGPVPFGLKSVLRVIVWKLIRTGLTAWEYAETGSAGAPVKTRVMLVRAIKD